MGGVSSAKIVLLELVGKNGYSFHGFHKYLCQNCSICTYVSPTYATCQTCCRLLVPVILDPLPAEIIPDIDRTRQAPMNTVIVSFHPLVPPELPRVSVWPCPHNPSDIQHSKLLPFLNIFPYSFKLLHLLFSHFINIPPRVDLHLPGRPCPVAGPTSIPHPVLEVRWGERPHHDDCFLALLAVVYPVESCPEGHLHCHFDVPVSHIRFVAVDATHHLGVLVDVYCPEEPMNARDDHVVQGVQVSSPVLVQPVEVQVVDASRCRAVDHPFFPGDHKLGPEDLQDEIVLREMPYPVSILRILVGFYWSFLLKPKRNRVIMFDQ